MTIPDQFAGACPFCAHRGMLARGENQCSDCGMRFVLSDPDTLDPVAVPEATL